MKNVFLLTLALTLSGISFSHAQGLADPCLADLSEFCGKIEQGGGRITKCLLEHKDNLAPGCRARVLRVQEILSSLKKSCESDLSKLCSDLEPGEGRLVHCLRDNNEKLSSACKIEMKKAQQARRSINETL